MIVLHGDEILDSEAEAHYAYHRSLKTVTGLHVHDFFEIFLITKGSVYHLVNGKRIHLVEGSLVLIRPEDIHCYENDGTIECQLLNLAFPKTTLDALFDYLGAGFDGERMLHCETPPSSIIEKHEIENVKSRFQVLTVIPNYSKAVIRSEVRALLADLFIRFFSGHAKGMAYSMPEWLKDVVHEMKNKENFTLGLIRLYEISPKSPEHVTRMIRKHLGMTPTEWINEFKLQYAANLLLHTDEPIVSICMESGFENLSHFYHRFRKYFQLSPAKYRKINRKIVIPQNH
jgi:AraC family transcriptional regulator, dual regulator of chb operon